MSSPEREIYRPSNYMGCFGQFRSIDRICRTHCAIRIRCAIETDQNMRMEFLEELFEEEDMLLNTH